MKGREMPTETVAGVDTQLMEQEKGSTNSSEQPI